MTRICEIEFYDVHLKHSDKINKENASIDYMLPFGALVFQIKNKLNKLYLNPGDIISITDLQNNQTVYRKP
jgi:hypothetical protein